MQPDDLNEASDIDAVHNPINPEEGMGELQDPLSLDIPDDELVKIIEHEIDADKKFWNQEYNLTERRKKTEIALFGRQVAEKEKKEELKKYEARYSDNAIYEIEATLKPVAMSHLPDLIVAPGTENEESKKSAEDVSKAVNDDIKKRDNRKVLGLGFKHLPVYFTAVIKARWNPELGDHGDYEFFNVHPDRIVISRSAKSNNVDQMNRVAELLPVTVQDLLMRFPKKKDELFDKLKSFKRIQGDKDFTWKDLATELDIWEVHFTWYKKAKEVDPEGMSIEEPGNKWEKIEGVLWKYEDIIFDKMRTPNFDYEGEERWFKYDDPSDENSKLEISAEEMMISAMTGQMPPNMSIDQIYHNYFKAPHKPYFFFGYDQWGKVAIDETSRIEQNLTNQDNLNTQGKQIIDTLKARAKHIWSTDSGLAAEDVQNMDMDNPKLDALVDGNVNETHKVIEPERPDAAQFNALQMNKDNMFALAGAQSLTGDIKSDVATTNQIAREQNFTRADDLVEDTINAASEWMAQWAMQFIKLRYTEEHFRRLLGSKGSFTFLKLNRDQIEDGMEVMIKSSGTDKLKAQRNAMDAAKLGPPFVNPIDFFKDMEYSDPEGRAERGMVFAIDPNTYMVKYVMGLNDANAMGAALNGTPPVAGQPAPASPMGGQPAAPQTPPMAPSAQDTSAVPTMPPIAPQGSPRGI